jgi:hypothetical protein
MISGLTISARRQKMSVIRENSKSDGKSSSLSESLCFWAFMGSCYILAYFFKRKSKQKNNIDKK